MQKILIDNGHGSTTAGKRSPDGRLLEYKWAREIASRIVAALRAKGYDAERIVTEEADISLTERTRRVNAICDRLGKRNVTLVSIHCNAAGNGKEWLNARGWEAWTSKGRTQSDTLAECLYKAARKHLPDGTRIRTDITDGDSDKESNFAILHKTKCAACLTENLFQDNKEDVDYLLSEEGKRAIVSLHVEGIVNYLRTRKP